MAAEELQLLDVMLGVFAPEHGQFHPIGIHDQEQQQLDRPVTHVLGPLLLDRAGLDAPDRLALQDLEVGDLSSTAMVQIPWRASRGGRWRSTTGPS